MPTVNGDTPIISGSATSSSWQFGFWWKCFYEEVYRTSNVIVNIDQVPDHERIGEGTRQGRVPVPPRMGILSCQLLLARCAYLHRTRSIRRGKQRHATVKRFETGNRRLYSSHQLPRASKTNALPATPTTDA